ncbi:hypothetical protein FRC07_004493 [Ceratobasidium sp. 392]|nr:hypothetical protein FRC07_004493 [Ceratobasidium sp. 392]
MSSQPSGSAVKRFIAVEYEGRQVAVRRSANYDIMLTLAKEAFRPLSSISAERILISAFVEDIGNTLEVSKGIWPNLLPELNHITIVLDNASLNVEESESESKSEDDDPMAESQSHLEEDDQNEELSEEEEDVQPDPVPELLPPAPVPDKNIRKVLHKIPT